MQKWEYVTAEIGMVTTGRAGFDDAALKQYGAEGWELVSVVPFHPNMNDSTIFMGVFKRPMR